MAYWLASGRDGQDHDWIQRFDPRFWTVDFPRPMMASVVTSAPDALRVDLAFLRAGDLAGLIWVSVDTFDHPLLAYRTDRDYSRTTLSFRWRSQGILALDAVNGPTLTIEGRDASGVARTWYVRLWNYAVGTAEDAQVTLPFSELVAGWTIAGGEQVYPSAIERLFISMVPPGFDAGSTSALASAVAGWVELTGIRCEGSRAMLEIGDVAVPPQGLAMATAYDDCCTQTPARLVRGLRQLGYRGSVLHYVGMSHFMRLAATSGGAYLVMTSGDPLCGPARAWHAAFFAECGAAGFERRSSLWSNARLRFDVGPGIRSESELGLLIAFFRARRGAARGFRMRDPSDFSSNAMAGTPGAGDQLLGLGDGTVSRFALVKHYGDGVDDAVQSRRITRPVGGSVRVTVAGSEVTSGWVLESGGVVSFTNPPTANAEVRAGFLFEVPVRFAEDKLEISGHAFAAGEAPSVPIIEIREAA